MNQPYKKRCLVADDVRPYRVLLKKWLSEWGYECTTVTHATDALPLIESGSLDSVITDIDMPGMDGLQFIRAIRNADYRLQRRTPVIAISSLQDDAVEPITKRVGALHFLPKPLDKESLRKTLELVQQASTRENVEPLPGDVILSKNGRVSPRLRRIWQSYQEPPGH